MSLLTSEEITNLYLYGDKNIPDNLESESIIRPSNAIKEISVDVNEYMTTGPGRFASPAFFDVIKLFFSSTTASLAPNTAETPYYTKYEIANAIGIDKLWIGLQQSAYDDGKDNYLERSYIWETTAFKIDNQAKFIIDTNGNRYIKDFAIVPYSANNNTEDFDLKSDSGFSKLTR